MSKQDKSFKESLKTLTEKYFGLEAQIPMNPIENRYAYLKEYDEAIIKLVEQDIIGEDNPADSNGRYNLKIEQRKALKS